MEKYLNKCLDSLIVDNMDLLEVLIINDGSKDRSLEIAHEYEKRYPQTFHVINKENGNYGSCINRGLIEATGKYIKILDADDRFNTDNLKKFLVFINENDADLFLTDYVTIDENDIIKNKFNYKLSPLRPLNFFNLYSKNQIDFPIQMHGVTYKRENLLAMNYKQTEGISYTDQEWVFMPMTKVKTGIYFNKTLYKYLVGREGQTVENSIMMKQSKQLSVVILSLLNKYHSNLSKEYNSHLINQLKAQLYIYKKALIENSFDLEILNNLDYEIKIKCPELYKLTNDISICKFKYISYWRNHNYNPLPFLIRKILAFRSLL